MGRRAKSIHLPLYANAVLDVDHRIIPLFMRMRSILPSGLWVGQSYEVKVSGRKVRRCCWLGIYKYSPRFCCIHKRPLNLYLHFPVSQCCLFCKRTTAPQQAS